MPDQNDEKRDEIINEFLRQNPRSEEWRQWREALELRLQRLKRERSESKDKDEVIAINERIEEIEDQIEALTTEEIISEFVEAEVNLSLNSVEPEEEWGFYGENGHSEE